MLHHTGTARYVTFQVHHSFQYTRQYTGAEYFEVRAIKAVSMQVFKCWKMGHFHKKDPPPQNLTQNLKRSSFITFFFQLLFDTAALSILLTLSIRSCSEFSRLRAGPAKALPERVIGYAPLHITYFDVICWHGVCCVPTFLMPSFCFCTQDL